MGLLTKDLLQYLFRNFLSLSDLSNGLLTSKSWNHSLRETLVLEKTRRWDVYEEQDSYRARFPYGIHRLALSQGEAIVWYHTDEGW
jgi:hypothetical protein